MNNHYHQYSLEHTQFIIDNYTTMSNIEMAKKLGRSRDSIRRKLKKEGLERTAVQIKLIMDNSNSSKTRFKKGRQPGNALYDGAITIRTDAKTGIQYRWIRLAVGKWKELHRLNWEKLHGPIAEGKVLRCRDGNPLNAHPSNWQLIERRLNLEKNYNREKMSKSRSETFQKLRRLSKPNSEKVEKLLKKLNKKREADRRKQKAKDRKLEMRDCAHCGHPFKPVTVRSRFCSEPCSSRGNYLALQRRRKNNPTYNGQAALRDEEEKREFVSRQKALEASPDTSQLVPVRIDHRTVIYIRPGKSIEKAKENYHLKYNNYGIDNQTNAIR